jgi:hypothetical protein
MTPYHALVIELLTRTGGVTGSLYRVEAKTSPDAVAKICSALGCGQGRVYLLSEEETAVWESGGVKVKTILAE